MSFLSLVFVHESEEEPTDTAQLLSALVVKIDELFFDEDDQEVNCCLVKFFVY